MRDPATELRRQIDRFLTDQSTGGVLRRGFAILLLVTLVTSWFSETFFHPDEHFQVLEFMSTKLGFTSPDALPWEYAARMRPWLQPFLYYLIAKPLMLAGLHDPFDLVFVLRLVTGALGLAALWVFAKFTICDLAREEDRRAYARMLPFMGFLPYLFVRTSSEALSAAFFTLGLVLAVRAARSDGLRRIAAAGLLCGLAFECRYQTALMSLGLFLWLGFIARARMGLLASFAAGAVAAAAAGLLIDRWGYGVWCVPAWTYLDVNVLQGVSSTKFSASPFFAYLYLELGTIFAPIAAVLVAALIVACLRNPRHTLTWATVPFVVVHCLLAHKEERFLFPLAILATAYPVLAFAPGRDRTFRVFERLWRWRRSLAAKAIGWSAAAAMLLLAVFPVAIRPHMAAAKYLYRHFPAGLTTYTLDQRPFTSYPMYWRPNFRFETLGSDAELEVLLAKGPVYVISGSPAAPVLPKDAHASVIYSEFPLPAQAARASQLLCDIAALRRNTRIRPPPVAWITLFRVQRDGLGDAQTAPCQPDWRLPAKPMQSSGP